MKIVVYSNGEDWESITEDSNILLCDISEEQFHQLEQGKTPAELNLSGTSVLDNFKEYTDSQYFEYVPEVGDTVNLSESGKYWISMSEQFFDPGDSFGTVLKTRIDVNSSSEVACEYCAKVLWDNGLGQYPMSFLKKVQK